MSQLLDGAVEPKQRKTRTPRAEAGGETDREAPYGRKKNGTSKARPRRIKKAAE